MGRNLMQRKGMPAGRASEKARPRRLVRTLLHWYTAHGRDLPWREISNPYHILVSEVMLQQTQVSRVLERYHLFLRRFPSIRSLARASQREVVVAWQGMGYNNRAVRLHQLARIVEHRHGGTLPADHDALLGLPGIGKYTAHALLSSAFGQQVAVVDVNIHRVLSRVFWKMTAVEDVRGKREIWTLASRLLPRGAAYRWNQALMDIGATICTARNPACSCCPVARMCRSRGAMVNHTARPLRIEPLLGGVPNRIYRGRIIRELSQRNGHGRTRVDFLGKRIYPRFGRRDERWLSGLLAGLQRDGLITLQGTGSLSRCHVSLA
jgi:A/G-specific adenine glycosylase